MGWKLFQLSDTLPGFGTEITLAVAMLWGLFGRSRRQCKILKAMYHIWGRCASECIWRDIVWALNFTTLDQFNCRGTFSGQEKHDKETFSTGE